MNMSAYLSAFTYLLLLSPDKQRQTTNEIDTQAHFFKSPLYQKEVSWLAPGMLTKRGLDTAPSMAHTCKPPPEPPPKDWLLIKSINHNSLANQDDLGSNDPSCLADLFDPPITIASSTATRSGPTHLPAT
jgi:hypothetical protein